ncbi:MAG: endopeptidase [Gaiellaceae bacterium]|nr:endopeptidase [Gaiellaceae bacterium]
MPARRAFLLRGVVVALLGAGWAVAAWFLWRSKLPSGLDLPHVDASAVFGASNIRQAASFDRFVRIDALLAELALLGVLGVYAARGERLTRESAAGPIGTGMLLGMLGFAFVWLVQLPFGLAELWWERRHDVSRVGYVEWVFGDWSALGGKFLFVCLALLIVMALARRMPRYWWLPAAGVFVGLAALFAFILPWLISPTHALRNPQLAAQARRLERVEGTGDTRIVVQDVHRETSAPNAESAGFGPSRRVILWDTLLDERFSNHEVRFVIAHELGHVARSHVLKSIGWYSLFAVPGVWAIAFVTRRRGGMGEPAAVPLGLLVLVVLGFVAQPVQNVISRHMEAEADWLALQATHDPAAGRALFKEFASSALEEPNPPFWAYALYENHPTLAQRIAMVDAWEARRHGGR